MLLQILVRDPAGDRTLQSRKAPVRALPDDLPGLVLPALGEAGVGDHHQHAVPALRRGGQQRVPQAPLAPVHDLVDDDEVGQNPVRRVGIGADDLQLASGVPVHDPELLDLEQLVKPGVETAQPVDRIAKQPRLVPIAGGADARDLPRRGEQGPRDADRQIGRLAVTAGPFRPQALGARRRGITSGHPQPGSVETVEVRLLPVIDDAGQRARLAMNVDEQGIPESRWRLHQDSEILVHVKDLRRGRVGIRHSRTSGRRRGPRCPPSPALEYRHRRP